VVYKTAATSVETTSESQSKIEYFGHNWTQLKSRYQQGIVRFRSHTLFRSCTISVH